MKKMKLLFAAASLALVFSACDKDNDNTNDVGVESSNPNDVNFALQASNSNTMEIILGRLAASMATNTGVRTFGQMMVTEHTPAQAQLQTAANNAHLAVSLDSSAAISARTSLMQLSGRAFDSAYITMQVQGHTQTLQLLQTEVAGGASPSLKGYASAQIPVVTEHLRIADSLRRNL
ncbi:DUF4142 domain-containing protein [Flaviaesturariibacter flavus]|uniref:DUF4142 domain-containing protein n=1 Tax=Flaviaesturariibacter flavus TaxID=2502780 RepID=A0A4R1BP31_9BACT|nr:DUF4142 domain-containing protein [Flaviaesturariibacter flavus]TCJ19005.1 DUF4142 domain-containing protein [Flaviaesturariibacter flavus]